MRLADVSGRGLNRISSRGTELQGSGDRDSVPALTGRSSSKDLAAAGPTQTQDPIIKQEVTPNPSLWTN
jgi:hypothetical protein